MGRARGSCGHFDHERLSAGARRPGGRERQRQCGRRASAIAGRGAADGQGGASAGRHPCRKRGRARPGRPCAATWVRR